jgi:hypothetical protein
MTYDKAFFIAKFEAIPEEDWTTEVYIDNGRKCALGHCGERNNNRSVEAQSLERLFSGRWLYVSDVNDGDNDAYPQPTPKQRILAALNDLP